MSWCADLIRFENFYLKIPPEIVRTELVRLWPVRARKGAVGDDGPVRFREENFNRDLDGFLCPAVVQCGLLRAVTAYKRVRILNDWRMA